MTGEGHKAFSEESMLDILTCKLLRAIGSKIGRGSSLPGLVCKKIWPKSLRTLKLPDKVIAVTGSNGKTSTVALLCNIAEKAGLKVVSNREGSNQTEGVVTALLSSADPRTRKVDADVVILESDERFCQYTFREFTPSHILITNLFRDQLTRNGHREFVKGELQKGIPDGTVLILNANEPLSCSYGSGREGTVYYGVSAPELREDPGLEHAYDDGAYCPVCGRKMEYDFRISGHVGSFECRKCGYRTPRTAHSVTKAANGKFVIDSTWEIRPQIFNEAYAQNISAAFTTAVEAMGVDPSVAAEALDGLELDNGRVVEFRIGGHSGRFMLCKHENSMAYNAAISTALSDPSEAVTVVFIVDRLSRKYVANDMSWLWDIDFHRLADDKVRKIILSGGFVHDAAERLLVGGVPEEKLIIEPDLDRMMDDVAERSEGYIYAMTCFTDQYKFLDRLKKYSDPSESDSKQGGKTE